MKNKRSSASSVSSDHKLSNCCLAMSANCIVQFCYSNVTHETLFWASHIVLGTTMAVTQFIALPVLMQMILYTFPIIYVGSHLSLYQKEIDPETGEKIVKTETMSHDSAMLFPFIGSAFLLLLYIAYKFLPSYWVNLLLTCYLSLFGCFAVGESLHSIVEKLTPASWSKNLMSINYSPPALIEKWVGTIDVHLSKRQFISYLGGAQIVLLWVVTKHWALHNLFAIGFCLQGIRIVSLGTFKTSVILLTGLFIYDIFWVFGTDVMVTVAKSFDAPAKLIFPVSHNPWKQNILGLGDIVLPGIFIAMILRFDHHLSFCGKEALVKHVETKTKTTTTTPTTSTTTNENNNNNFTIHQEFSKVYFWSNIIAYEVGMVLTGLIMLFFQRAQPALLYLVPACFLGLLLPAWYYGQLQEVFNYSEEILPDGSEEENEKKKDQ